MKPSLPYFRLNISVCQIGKPFCQNHVLETYSSRNTNMMVDVIFGIGGLSSG